MFSLCAAILMASALVSDGLAMDAGQEPGREPVRVYTFALPEASEGAKDSAKDVRDFLKHAKSLIAVDKREDAEVSLEIVNRRQAFIGPKKIEYKLYIGPKFVEQGEVEQLGSLWRPLTEGTVRALEKWVADRYDEIKKTRSGVGTRSTSHDSAEVLARLAGMWGLQVGYPALKFRGSMRVLFPIPTDVIRTDDTMIQFSLSLEASKPPGPKFAVTLRFDSASQKYLFTLGENTGTVLRDVVLDPGDDGELVGSGRLLVGAYFRDVAIRIRFTDDGHRWTVVDQASVKTAKEPRDIIEFYSFAFSKNRSF